MQDFFHQQYDGTKDGQGQSNQPLRKIPAEVVDITHMLHGNGIFDFIFYGKCRYRYSMHEAIWVTQFLQFFFGGFWYVFVSLSPPCPEVREHCAAFESPIFISPNKEIDESPTIHTWKMLPLAPQALNFQKNGA